MIPIWLGPTFVMGKLVYDYYNRKRKIAVLGLQGAGKTTFQNYFREVQYTGSTPPEGDIYENPNEFKVPNTSKRIVLQEGRDVSGSNEAIRNTYPEVINESDTIFYLFDVDKFFENEEYKGETKALLFFILSRKKKQKIILLASHADLLARKSSKTNSQFREDLYESLIELTEGKKVKGPFLLNLLDSNDLEKMKPYFL